MPLQYNYNMNEEKAVFPLASDPVAAVVKQESVAPENCSNGMKSVFSPLAPPFQSRVKNDMLTYMSQQEPREADTAPVSNDLDDVFATLRLNNSDLAYDDIEYNPQQYFSATKAEPMPASQPNIWSEGGSPPAKNGDSIDTFDFLIKSLSSANNFISMLSREQLSVMQAIRPRVLYDFLLEVARVRTDKRLRRALPNECAFCKNNGENEEHYSSHSLKDWRGRVLCPVLRAFRCPRCGATGDRAHTIKYCPEPSESGLDRSGSFLYRRRVSSASSVLLGANGRTPNYTGSPSPTSAPSPPTNLSTSMWSNFGLN